MDYLGCPAFSQPTCRVLMSTAYEQGIPEAFPFFSIKLSHSPACFWVSDKSKWFDKWKWPSPLPHVLVLSRVRLFATPWTVACQASLSIGFSRQEYWSGLPCPPPEDLPDPGIESTFLTSPVLAGGFFTTKHTREALCLFDPPPKHTKPSNQLTTIIVHTGPRKLQMNPVSVFSQQLWRKTGVSHCIQVPTLKWLTPCQICLWKSIGGWGWSENFLSDPLP